MNTEVMRLFVDILRTGADAADRVDACHKCNAKPGDPCVTTTRGKPWGKNHGHRLPGDPVLSFALREMADDLEQRAEKLESESG